MTQLLTPGISGQIVFGSSLSYSCNFSLSFKLFPNKNLKKKKKHFSVYESGQLAHICTQGGSDEPRQTRHSTNVF